MKISGTLSVTVGSLFFKFLSTFAYATVKESSISGGVMETELNHRATLRVFLVTVKFDAEKDRNASGKIVIKRTFLRETSPG